MVEKSKLQARFGASEHGNFAVVDTIGLPHPYCIGSRHVAYAADHCNGTLDKEAIIAAERAGAKCCTPRCTLKYEEHEHALLIECKKPFKDEEGKADPELHAYLRKIQPAAIEDNYAGFAFKSEKKEEEPNNG